MNRRHLLAGLFAGMLACSSLAGGSLLVGEAQAHRMPVTVTTIDWLQDGTLGITHRFHTHDAIRILKHDDVRRVDPTSLEHQARIALYVSEHFKAGLPGEKGGLFSSPRPVPLEAETLGAEMDGDYFFVYQQLTLPEGTDTLWFRSTLLEELSNDWLSHINVETASAVRSLTFTGRGRWQDVAL